MDKWMDEKMNLLVVDGCMKCKWADR